jgi:hypothetical protein
MGTVTKRRIFTKIDRSPRGGPVRVSESDKQRSHSPVEGGVTSSGQTPPFVEKKAPFQNTQKSGNNKNMVSGPDWARKQE